MLLKKTFPVNFSKNLNTSENSNLFFLRKSRSFVKSRFSRNRQWSKSIVYFSLWFNLLSVLWSFFFCYRYSLIFNYFFWIVAALLLLVSIKHLLHSNFDLLRGW